MYPWGREWVRTVREGRMVWSKRGVWGVAEGGSVGAVEGAHILGGGGVETWWKCE